MLSRIRQGLTCMFAKYDGERYEEVVSGILSPEEKEIFDGMDEYDKVHSVNLLFRVSEDHLLSQDMLYRKLALLHDCGKGHVTLMRRVKKVMVGDRKLEEHPNLGYEKLKDINSELADLCRKHHTRTAYSIKMSTFQKLDDM